MGRHLPRLSDLRGYVRLEEGSAPIQNAGSATAGVWCGRPVTAARGGTAQVVPVPDRAASAFLKERVLSTLRRPQGGTLLGLIRLQ